LKRVEVVKAEEVEVAPFILEDFTEMKHTLSKIEPVSKKDVKKLADELGVAYDESHIAFAKKMINAYIKKR
jgi:hypothetical protein